ncbi:MAG: DUF2232 domain-containing protein [Rhizobiales bacterium]|nr:DUF2232 domain-containing protein [Hyphomicrobiales bacterium]MBA70098.1 DUF2232 domain-containing protein [Hyphomicrobiales bacterium]
MQDTKAISALVGLIAGIASAFLLAGAVAPSYMAMLLIASASLPVLIAGLGWSNTASIVAVIAGTALISVMSGPLAALSAALTSLGPAAWIAHLSNLARPAEEIGGPEGRLAWYPLSDILAQVCAIVAVVLVILGYVMGYGPELSGELVDSFVSILKEGNPDLTLDPASLAEMKSMMRVLLPLVQGATWVGILFGMYYIARGIVTLSGRGKRPRDDVPAQLRMPRTALYTFGIGIAITLLAPAPYDLVGWVIAGSFGAGFILSGFALMHFLTRGKSWRPIAIWIAYVTVILFTVPLIFFLVFGLTATGRLSTMSPNQPKS